MQKQTMIAALVLSAMALNGAFAESDPVVSLTTATQKVQAANDTVKSVSDSVMNSVSDKTDAVKAATSAASALSTTTNIVPTNKSSLVDGAQKMAQDTVSEKTDAIISDVAGDSGIVASVAKETVSEESDGLITKIFSIFQSDDDAGSAQ